jgi:signal peptidase I
VANRAKKRYQTARSLGITVLAVLIFRAFVAEAYMIPSGSMEPTLKPGDRLVVNKLAYGLRLPFTTIKLIRGQEPRPGEIVIFAHPRQPETTLIKRVIASGGDTVAVRDNVVLVNGKPDARWQIASPCPVEQRPCQAFEEQRGETIHTVLQHSDMQPRDFGPFKVPADHIFVMGDNRDNSSDSRFWGTVPYSHLQGRAVLIYWSRGDDGLRGKRMFRLVHRL